MIKFQSEINGKLVRMYSKNPLKNAGTALLRTLNAVSKKVDIFQEGFALNYGWATFVLDKRVDEDGKGYYLLQTFDYLNDPALRVDDCGVALVVQNMQVNTNTRAKVAKPEPVTYRDTILVLKDAINAEDVYMNRSDVTKKGDSGWYFGLLNDEKEDQHEPDELVSVPTYMLLKIRPEALRVLQMPVGTVAVFHENEMTALVDKDDKPLEFSTSDERKQAIAKRAAAEAAAAAESRKDSE